MHVSGFRATTAIDFPDSEGEVFVAPKPQASAPTTAPKTTRLALGLILLGVGIVILKG